MIRIVISILLCCSMAFAGDEMRLPGDVRPSSYDIRLLPNFEDDFKIQGHIEITIVCVQDTNRVVLNSADIDVDEFSVKVHYNINHICIYISNISLTRTYFFI